MSMRTAVVAGAIAVAAIAAADQLPKGYRQAVPRGLIASIDNPRFVPAGEARIPDEAWVLGVVVEGQARAYSLNLLNRHEVVNDRADGTAFAVVWCPLANAGVVYERSYRGRELRFEASGGLLNAALVMRDKETGSYWPIISGGAATGPLAGTRLEDLPQSAKAQWRDWVRAHPDTLVLSVRGVEHVRDDPYSHYFSSRLGFGNLAALDKRLPTKEPVWAFERGGGRFAIPHRAIEAGGALALGDHWLFFHRPPGASIFLSTRAFASPGRFVFQDGAWIHEPTGASFDTERGVFQGSPPGVEPLAGFDTFWYVWSLTHPDTELLGPAS
jgi:hypothetical protein